MKIEKILTTNESKTGFLLGLVQLAKCNGIVDASERAFFEQAAISLHLGDKEIEIIKNAWEQENDIDFDLETTEQKMFFFIEAIQLCWIDDKYDEAERKEIRRIANKFNISEDAVLKVEAWVEEGINWNKRAEELLELK